MATFAPDVQQVQEPEFLNYFRPTSQIAANTSKETLFKGLGEAFDETVEGADKVVKGLIGDTEANKTQPLQDAYVASLQTKDNLSTPTTAAATVDANGNAMSLMPDETKPVPTNVNSAISSAQSLTAARANGNLSETAYLGKLYSVLKDVRSQFPGYRDYVDQKMSQITGKDVANDYIKSMTSDINAQQAALKEEHTKITNELWTAANAGNPGAKMKYQQWNAGQLTKEQAFNFITDSNASEWAYKNKQRDASSHELDQKQDKEVAGQLADDLLNKSNQAFWSHTTDSLGKSPSEILDNIRNGRYNPDQAQADGQSVLQQKGYAQAQMLQDMNDPTKGHRGKSLAYWLGPDETNKVIQDRLQNYDSIYKMFYDDKAGIAYASTNAAKVLQSNTKLSILQDKNLGRYIMLQEAVGNSGGEVQKALTQHYMDLKIGDSLRTWLTMTDLAAANGSSAGSNSTLPTTMSSAIDELRQGGISTPQSYKSLVEIVDHVSDPKIPDNLKLGYIHFAFDPANGGLLQKIKEQHEAFNKMTSPDITKEIFRLDQKYPGVANTYKNWALQSFDRDLFPSTLAAFKSYEDNKLGIGIKYNSDRSDFEAFSKVEGDRSTPDELKQTTRERVRDMNRTLVKLNYGLHNIANIARAENVDPNTYIIKTMQQLKALHPDMIQGLPKQFYDATMNQRNTGPAQ